MDALSKTILTLSFLGMCSCHLGYYLKNTPGQISLLTSRQSVEKSLQDKEIKDEDKRKIRLAIEAKSFAETQIGLKKTSNYSSYVQLDRPYVTYVVSAAQKWELKPIQWDFLVVGSVPYKGYYKEADAKSEEAELKSQNLDTYLRGVSAFSSVGIVSDPLLSSMMNYKDHDLVNTIIHETVHSTIYIKNSADFNERLAVFVGNKATEDFYKMKEGTNSPTLALIQNENYDEKLFSEFITYEIKELENWYKIQKEKNEDLRKDRIRKIQEKFKAEIFPNMKSDLYRKFPELELNNARILVYRTYMQDLSDFEKLFEMSAHNFQNFISNCRKLETHPKPEEGLKELIN